LRDLRLAAALALVAALAGCGFQLRGDAPMGIKSIHVTTVGTSSVATEVRRRLSGGPTKLSPTLKDAEAHLRINAETPEKSILTLTGAGRVYEYQLRLRVEYQVSDAAGRMILETTQLELRRNLTFSETAPLAKEAEEAQLYADMRQEAAAIILRRIAVATGGGLAR
jgi:LPS-assembly lipoprotein